MAKQIKKIKTGAIARGISLASLSLRAGAKAASHAALNILSSETVQEARKKIHLIEQATLFAKEMGALKGSLMKAGQMLSVYGEHFLPPEANKVLKSLQSDSVFVDWQEIEKVIKRQLDGKLLASLEINAEPIAAASLGQVHQATIKSSGESIVLKVQYPGVDKAIDGDLKVLRKLLSMADFLPNLPATDDLFAEVKSMLRQELDYEKELEMLNFFRQALESNSSFIVPKPYPQYCTKRVLALHYEPGKKIDSDEIRALGANRKSALAKSMLELYFSELFLWKKVQTDPHFGNYRIRTGKKSDQWILYDFGAVRTLSESFVQKYKNMLLSLLNSDRELFEKHAKSMGVLSEDDPKELKDTFYELCLLITEPFQSNEEYVWGKSDLPQRVSKITWEMFRKFPLRQPPRELVFLDRKMAGIFTLMTTLEARIPSRDILLSYIK